MLITCPVQAFGIAVFRVVFAQVVRTPEVDFPLVAHGRSDKCSVTESTFAPVVAWVLPPECWRSVVASQVIQQVQRKEVQW